MHSRIKINIKLFCKIIVINTIFFCKYNINASQNRYKPNQLNESDIPKLNSTHRHKHSLIPNTHSPNLPLDLLSQKRLRSPQVKMFKDFTAQHYREGLSLQIYLNTNYYIVYSVEFWCTMYLTSFFKHFNSTTKI